MTCIIIYYNFPLNDQFILIFHITKLLNKWFYSAKKDNYLSGFRFPEKWFIDIKTFIYTFNFFLQVRQIFISKNTIAVKFDLLTNNSGIKFRQQKRHSRISYNMSFQTFFENSPFCVVSSSDHNKFNQNITNNRANPLRNSKQ